MHLIDAKNERTARDILRAPPIYALKLGKGRDFFGKAPQVGSLAAATLDITIIVMFMMIL